MSLTIYVLLPSYFQPLWTFQLAEVCLKTANQSPSVFISGEMTHELTLNCLWCSVLFLFTHCQRAQFDFDRRAGGESTFKRSPVQQLEIWGVSLIWEKGGRSKVAAKWAGQLGYSVGVRCCQGLTKPGGMWCGAAKGAGIEESVRSCSHAGD